MNAIDMLAVSIHEVPINAFVKLAGPEMAKHVLVCLMKETPSIQKMCVNNSKFLEITPCLLNNGTPCSENATCIMDADSTSFHCSCNLRFEGNGIDCIPSNNFNINGVYLVS